MYVKHQRLFHRSSKMTVINDKYSDVSNDYY